MARVCRTCLCEGADVNIFDKSTSTSSLFDESSPSVCTMVFNCTQLNFSEDDGLPAHICRKCLDIVMKAFAFKLQARKAEEQLKNFMLTENKLKAPDGLTKKEEDCRNFNEDLIIKTEIDDLDDYDNDMPVCSRDDSDDDLKPLIEFKSPSRNVETITNTKPVQNTVPCNLCDESFLSPLSLDDHLQMTHFDCIQCDICLRKFTTKSYLSRHKAAAHSSLIEDVIDKNEFDRAISCILCGLKFNREDQLISHINLSHREPRKRGRPSKKDIITNKLKLKKILESMNIKTEDNDDYYVEKNSDELLHSITCTPSIIDTKTVIDPEMDTNCSFCSKTFYSYSSLEKHTAKHIDYKPSFCKLCNKTFKYGNALKEHLQSHVSESFVLVDLKLKTNLLENHEKLSDKSFDLTDDSIKEIIKDDIKAEKYEFYFGEIKIPENENITDSESDSVCSVSDKLKAKRKTRSNITKPKLKKYRCSLCGQYFSRCYHVMRHMSTHKFDYPDKCDFCNKVFPNKILLKIHQDRNCVNNKSYSCELCSMRYSKEISLFKHMSRNHGGKTNIMQTLGIKMEQMPFNCPTCEKQFYRKDHLKKHLRVHVPKEKNHECPICMKKFFRKDNLKNHMSVHNKKKRIKKSGSCLCMYCGKSFANSSHLLIHVRRHKNENPFKCDICGKGFPRTSDLKYHRRTHTGERPYQCTICGKGFARSDKLRRHMRIHTGDRPYKCTYCDRAFTQSNDLTLHVRRHTGDKPYICRVCGDRFIQGTALHNHKRLHSHHDPVDEES